MKLTRNLMHRLIELPSAGTDSTEPHRVSIFQSRVVMIAIASALTLAQPSIEKFVVKGEFDRRSLYKLGQSLAMIAGVVAYRYSVDDTKYYTPQWMPGANKDDE